jgi:hypothetical protein
MWTKLMACRVAKMLCIGLLQKFDLSIFIAKQQGSTVENGLVKRRTFVLNHKAKDLGGKGALLHSNRLFVCEENIPPKYRNNSGNIVRFQTLSIL